MKVWNWLKSRAALAACVGILISPVAHANSPTSAPEAAAPGDVALAEGGLLVGRVVDHQGKGRPGEAVSVRQGEHVVVQAVADENGVFAAQGLRGGQYTLATANGASQCRLWAPRTAPPGATPNAVVVCGDEVVRGQYGYMHNQGHAWIEWMKAHPYITGGAIAGAIAIPLAFADEDDKPGS